MDEMVLGALRQVVDPELGINMVDLGLVYSAEVVDGQVRVAMTLTTPGCPLTQQMAEWAEAAIRRQMPGVRTVDVQLVWTPP
jgi:metal-sulfur cluster biosynthetic enzyme